MMTVDIIVIARGQGFMAINRPESEGEARGQWQFMIPGNCAITVIYPT